MAKRSKCNHGNNAIHIEGCANCAVDALGGFNLLRKLGVSPRELMEILWTHYDSPEQWAEAVAAAKAKVNRPTPGALP